MSSGRYHFQHSTVSFITLPDFKIFKNVIKMTAIKLQLVLTAFFSGFGGPLLEIGRPLLFFYIYFLSLMVSSFSSHVSLASTKLVLPENKNNTNPLLYIHIIWQLFLQIKSYSDSYLRSTPTIKNTMQTYNKKHSPCIYIVW